MASRGKPAALAARLASCARAVLAVRVHGSRHALLALRGARAPVGGGRGLLRSWRARRQHLGGETAYVTGGTACCCRPGPARVLHGCASRRRRARQEASQPGGLPVHLAPAQGRHQLHPPGPQLQQQALLQGGAAAAAAAARVRQEPAGRRLCHGGSPTGRPAAPPSLRPAPSLPSTLTGTPCGHLTASCASRASSSCIRSARQATCRQAAQGEGRRAAASPCWLRTGRAAPPQDCAPCRPAAGIRTATPAAAHCAPPPRPHRACAQAQRVPRSCPSLPPPPPPPPPHAPSAPPWSAPPPPRTAPGCPWPWNRTGSWPVAGWQRCM
jgi:hypothetical protein